MVQHTLKVMEALFGNAPPSPDEPSLDELFDYANALTAGEEVAVQFPAVHQYVEEEGKQNSHYQALLVLLGLERAGMLESPPPAHFAFGPAPPDSPAAQSAQPWRVELGQLFITLSETLIAAFTPAPQIAYQRSAGGRTLLELDCALQQSGVTVSVQARTTAADAEQCAVVVGVTLPNRRWPHLSGIPVALTVADKSSTTQLTDAFGKTVFPAVPVAGLGASDIAVGPLAELADDQP